MFEFNWGVFWAILAAFAAIDVIRWLYNRVVMLRLICEMKNAPPLPILQTKAANEEKDE